MTQTKGGWAPLGTIGRKQVNEKFVISGRLKPTYLDSFPIDR